MISATAAVAVIIFTTISFVVRAPVDKRSLASISSWGHHGAPATVRPSQHQQTHGGSSTRLRGRGGGGRGFEC